MKIVETNLKLLNDIIINIPFEVKLMIFSFFILVIFYKIFWKTSSSKRKEIDKDLFFFNMDDIPLPTVEITNFKIDNYQTIDKFIINEYGVYLMFEYPKTKGILSGDIDDEFLFIKKDKLLNPLNEKNSYIKKISKKYNLNKDLIKIIIIYPKIKNIKIETNVLVKNKEDYVFEGKKVYSPEEMYNLSERFDRIKRT